MGVPILSLKLGLSFGSALNFYCGYQCICMFMVVAVEGCCGGDGDGFTVGLRRWLQIWVRFVLCCSGSVGLRVLKWVYGWLVVAVCFWSNFSGDGFGVCG